MSSYTREKEVIAISKVYQYGKTHIPIDVQKRLGLDLKKTKKDKIIWFMHNGQIVVERV